MDAQQSCALTIIGIGNMARGLATRAVAAGRSIQLLAQEDKAKAEALAAELGGKITTGVVRPQRRARQLEHMGFLHILLSANEESSAYQWNSALKVLPGA